MEYHYKINIQTIITWLQNKYTKYCWINTESIPNYANMITKWIYRKCHEIVTRWMYQWNDVDTSLEVSVRIRSKSSTSSPKVGRSIGLYCQHSRIKRYLQEQSIKSIKSILENVVHLSVGALPLVDGISEGLTPDPLQEDDQNWQNSHPQFHK